MTDTNYLIDKVIEWAGDRGILGNATPAAQYQKTVEEVGELGRALVEEADATIDYALATHANTGQYTTTPAFIEASKKVKEKRADIEDAIGDIVVTLIIQCELNDLNLETCLEKAYNVIAQRKGKMINGQFVKEE